MNIPSSPGRDGVHVGVPAEPVAEGLHDGDHPRPETGTRSMRSTAATAVPGFAETPDYRFS